MNTPSALHSLSTKLCPWLEPALAQLEAAHRNGQLGHAWLFSGPAGTGKLNLALVFAHRLLKGSHTLATLGPDEALTALAACHDPADHDPDLHWLFPAEDKETISVEQVRDVSDALALTAHGGRAKIVIVEPAEAMTVPAANALLKTLEEPSADSYLLLLSRYPGRLPATIRSRCQHLKLAPPASDVTAAWLGLESAAVVEVGHHVGRAPLAVAAALKADDLRLFNELDGLLAKVSEDQVDPQAVAQSWSKDQTDRALTWLKGRLYEELRSRLGSGGSTGITVPSSATLHNAWRGLTSRTLFDQYEKTEKLLNQLGSGINVELALQALLGGFQMNRGRS